MRGWSENFRSTRGQRLYIRVFVLYSARRLWWTVSRMRPDSVLGLGFKQIIYRVVRYACVRMCRRMAVHFSWVDLWRCLHGDGQNVKYTGNVCVYFSQNLQAVETDAGTAENLYIRRELAWSSWQWDEKYCEESKYFPSNYLYATSIPVIVFVQVPSYHVIGTQIETDQDWLSFFSKTFSLYTVIFSKTFMLINPPTLILKILLIKIPFFPSPHNLPH